MPASGQFDVVHGLAQQRVGFLLVADGEVFVQRCQRRVLSQEARSPGVEGAGEHAPGALVGQRGLEALSEVAGSAVGEGEYQDLFRWYGQTVDQPFNAGDGDAGFARAGTGGNQGGADGSVSGALLFGVQFNG